MNISYTLPDKRLSKRANLSFSKLIENPNSSFPKIFDKQSELTGFYRLINNNGLSSEVILNSVYQTTFSNIPESASEVVVAHDSSEIANKAKGVVFKTHVSLLANAGDSKLVYGVGSGVFWEKIKKADGGEGNNYKKWMNGVEACENQCSGKKLIHLMDREADAYAHFCELTRHNRSFVIRVTHDKNLVGGTKLIEELESADAMATIEAELSKRQKNWSPKKNKIHPPRATRKVTLNVKARSLRVKKSEWLKRSSQVDKEYPEGLTLKVVLVDEIDPPEGEQGVRWVLGTSEKIETEQDVLRVIDLYRKRWIVEEFFKALKSGCGLEKRQFDEVVSWVNLTSFLFPVAVALLNLRGLDEEGTEEIKKVLTETQIKILKKKAEQRGLELKKLIDYRLEIAKLGGHIKYNGPPGWQVLGRGLEKLLRLEEGWLLRE